MRNPYTPVNTIKDVHINSSLMYIIYWATLIPKFVKKKNTVHAPDLYICILI